MLRPNESNRSRRHLRQSVVTPLIKKAITLHRYAFCYLYPNIFDIGVAKNGFVYFKPVDLSWRLIPWFLSMSIVTGLLGWGSCVYTCVTQIIGIETKPWIEWSLFNTLIISGLGAAASAEIFGCFALYHSTVFFLAFSELLHLEHKCIYSIKQSNETGANEQTRLTRRDLLANEFMSAVKRSTMSTNHKTMEKDTIGFLLNGLVILVGIIPFPFVVVAIVTNLDPFYFVFEQLIMPHPYDRTIQMIVLVPLVRLFLGYFCVIEFLRFGTIGVFIIIIVVFVIVSISKKLGHVFYEECLRLYVQLRLVLASVKNLTDVLIGALIFGSQFATILVLWIVFKCYAFLSVYIYVGICLFAAYLIILASLLLPATAKVRTETKVLIRNKRNLHYCSSGHNSRKYYYYNLWKSQESTYFTCGSFFVVQKGVTMTYLREMINNLVNAVLLIDP